MRRGDAARHLRRALRGVNQTAAPLAWRLAARAEFGSQPCDNFPLDNQYRREYIAPIESLMRYPRREGSAPDAARTTGNGSDDAWLRPSASRRNAVRKSPWGAKNHGCPGRRDVAGRRGASRASHSRDQETDRARTTPRCIATKKAGALDNNNESASAALAGMQQWPRLEGSEPLESFRKGGARSRCSAACGDGEAKISRPGSSEHQAGTRSQGTLAWLARAGGTTQRRTLADRC